MANLQELPVEVLLDNILPVLPIRDVLALGEVDRRFHDVVDDETFWKRRCDVDFNFSGARTARTSGWKRIYKGLSNPKVYAWGYALYFSILDNAHSF